MASILLPKVVLSIKLTSAVMALISPRFAPLVYGVIQAAITSAVATTIATFQTGMSGLALLRYWFGCWSLSWLAMLPVVVLVSPLIQRAVRSLTAPVDTGPVDADKRI